MDGKKFGHKVRDLRKAKGVTREEFCGDEVELSIRQLARIESGQSIPTLAKVNYIAKRLGVTVGSLTDGDSLELPKRYKELKYLILRNPTYLDKERIELREEQFDEIFENYYDNLPEGEQLAIDCLQAKYDIYVSQDVTFGTGIIDDYFNQIKHKSQYTVNDLIMIDLYLVNIFPQIKKENFKDKKLYFQLVDRLLEQENFLDLDDLFILNNVLINTCDYFFTLSEEEYLETIISKCHHLMSKVQDFQKVPIVNLLEWKMSLYILKDRERGLKSFERAKMFSEMMNDLQLATRLSDEWEKDLRLLEKYN